MEWLTWAVLLMLAGAGLFLAVFAFNVGKPKPKTRKMLVWVVGGLIVLGGLPALGIYDYGYPQINDQIRLAPLAAGDQVTLAVGDRVVCPVEDTTVTLSAVNFFTQTATGGNHRYQVDGNPALTVSDAGTFTASPGDKISILWENASITGGFYSAVSEVEVPCSGTKTFSENLYQNGTITMRVFNEEFDLITSDSTDGSTGVNNETLANGDLVTLNAELIGTFQRGHPYGGVIVAEYDQTFYDDVKVELGGSGVNTPTVYAITNAGNTTKTYSFPALIGSTEGTGGKLVGSVIIDADDSNNPGSEDEVQFTIYTNNYFINEDTGGSFDGPAIEDEDDARTYTHSTISYLNVD